MRSSFDAEDFGEEDFDGPSLADLLTGAALTNINSINCPRRNVKRCTAVDDDVIDNNNQPLTEKGDFCVDYHIYYDEGDELNHFDDVFSAEQCRVFCESAPGCKFYTWFIDSCSLKSSANWEPVYEEDAISGSTLGECRNADYNKLDFCECQEFDYDYSSDGDVDLVGLGLIDVKSGAIGGGKSKDGCPSGQGKRCYLTKPVLDERAEPIKRLNIPDPTAVRFSLS